MIYANFGSNTVGSFYELDQWAYNQTVTVLYKDPIPDGTGVQIFQQNKLYNTSIINSSFSIPDKMLQINAQIKVIVYLNEDKGIILTGYFPIKERNKPEDYIEPSDYDGYKRLLPLGGSTNQVPVRIDDAINGVEWGYRADNLQLNDKVLTLLSGEVELSRVRLPVGTSGREIELKNNGVEIQWRYTDSNDWIKLIDLESIRGPAGETPEFEIREGHLYAIYQND